MKLTAQAIETASPFVAIVVVLGSLAFSRFKKTRTPMTVRETLSNIANFAVWRWIFYASALAMQIALFSAIARHIPWKVGSSGLAFVAAIVFADFLYYWKHRAEHEVSLLWAEHSVHHSSEEFNIATALRLPWVASWLNWPFLVPGVLVGFSPLQFIAAHQIVIVYMYLIHTEHVGRLPILDELLNTPSNHRVHHGKNPEYLDKNYGGILIIWDRLFGTFARETTPVSYGTVHRMESKNPFVINYQPWAELWAVCKTRAGWRRKVAVLFTAPGRL